MAASQTTSTILVVGPDPGLHREVADALRGIADGGGLVLQEAGDYRRGIEAARSRPPALALVEMNRDLRALSIFSEEMAVASPGTVVAAIVGRDAFGDDVSESAVIIDALRSGVQDFLLRPVSSADLERLLDRLLRRLLIRPQRLGRVVSFVGNKGGVGKSTVAVNTACVLARRAPGRVLLVDASLQLGVCASMLDLKPTTTMTDAVHERDRLDETLLRRLAVRHGGGLHLLAAPRDAIEAATVDDDAMARVLTLARRTYDYVIVDSFPMLDRVMMTVLDLSDRAYLVLESVVPTLLGGAMFLRLLDDLAFPAERRRVVLNRYFRYPGNLRPDDVAGYLGRGVDHVVPYRKSVVVATNAGRPLALRDAGFFGFGRAVRRIADGIVADLPIDAPAEVAPVPTESTDGEDRP